MKKVILGIIVTVFAVSACKKAEVKSPENSGDSTQVETDTLKVQDSVTIDLDTLK